MMVMALLRLYSTAMMVKNARKKFDQILAKQPKGEKNGKPLPDFL
jgi:hypothetical protein